MAEVEWNDLEIGHAKFKSLVEYWRDQYNWRSFEAYLNTFHHFMTQVPVSGFGSIDLHFLHHRSSRPNAIPLIFVHGWYSTPSLDCIPPAHPNRPGSFLESLKLIPLLSEPDDPQRQPFHVVVPSLPGYGFSSYSRKSGFGLEQYAACFANLMKKLGYNKYVCQVKIGFACIRNCGLR